MTATSPRILVTGAGGFIGSALLAPLAGRFGYVLAGVRRARPSLPGAVPSVACNLDELPQLRAAVRGADLVIHAAYGDEAAMARQCANLLEAMAQVGAPSLIALSSIAVYGLRPGKIDEATPPATPLARYAHEKTLCEKQIAAWSHAEPQRRAIVLRPGIVYGRKSPFWIDKMTTRIASGGWGLFGPRGEGRAALIHVDDLARQILAAAQLLTGAGRLDQPPFRALNAIGPECPSWNAYFSALAAAIGAPPLRRWSPAELALRQALAIPAKIAQRLRLPLGRAASLAPTPGEIDLFALQADYCGEAAARTLGFVPQIGLAEGLARSLPKTQDTSPRP